jgi:Tol biopolymer transport system component
LIGVAVALIALIFGDGRLRAKGETRGDGRIAFVAGESGAENPSQLAVMDADGKHVRALPPSDVAGMSLSPDGHFIAFTQYIAGSGCSCARGDLMTVTVDGRPRFRRVVHHDSLGGWGGLAWSPDGRSIAFALRGGGIWAVTLSDHRQRQLVRNGDDPSWSPDGRKLVYDRGRDLWVVDLATKKQRLLVRNGVYPDWSLDGRRIVFERCRAYECFIHVIRADGTGQRLLFAGTNPVWSPNGREIAFGVTFSIFRERLDGRGRRKLGMPLDYYEQSLDWSRAPHGR